MHRLLKKREVPVAKVTDEKQVIDQFLTLGDSKTQIAIDNRVALGTTKFTTNTYLKENRVQSKGKGGNQARIDQLLKENGEDLQDIANRLSLLLLEKFSQLTKVELATLKLSLSTIFNISSAEFKDVLQEHLSPKEFSMICKAKYSRKLNKEAEAEIDKVIKELQEESKKEEPNFGIKLGKKSSCTRENQIRLVYSFLYTSLKPKKKRAEFDYVKVVSLVLEYMLNENLAFYTICSLYYLYNVVTFLKLSDHTIPDSSWA
ncbi:hypothetical protein BD560DRAFT_450308 [Blakeslea trispora]|nr:hypothetical protein BD560DRAFT_450308 [Blakeslea trispora]